MNVQVISRVTKLGRGYGILKLLVEAIEPYACKIMELNFILVTRINLLMTHKLMSYPTVRCLESFLAVHCDVMTRFANSFSLLENIYHSI